MSDADTYALQLEDDLVRATQHVLWLEGQVDRLLAENKELKARLWMLENFLVHKGYDVADALMDGEDG